MGSQLIFREDKSFKIVQFTDVHWTDGSEADQRTNKLMEKILEQEEPDLVIFTGDMVYGENNEAFLRKALEPVNNSGIPWAAVFGNHDTELGSTKEKLLYVQQESANCYTEAGDSNISGVGNYYLPIYGSSGEIPCWILYLIDSSDYSKNEIVKGYDYIHRDQIEWYTKLSSKLRNQYGSLPALSFFHIPLPEYNEVWDYEPCYGEKNEGCCCAKQNSGLFSTMLEMGDVKGVFVGHDHINDYWGDLYGIKLCYGRATGYNTYVKEGFAHGARVIKLIEGKSDFETWVRLDDGSVILNPQKHMPERKSI